MSPESRDFDENVWIPQMHEIFGWFGIEITRTPLNGTFFFALICLLLVWRFVWFTRWGYELRTVGTNESAAVYAGINVSKNIIIAMIICGGLSGFVGINEIMGFPTSNPCFTINFDLDTDALFLKFNICSKSGCPI